MADTPTSNTINVLAEFERAGIKFNWASDDTIRIKCPFHDDEHPSCVVTVSSGHFKCFVPGCSAIGDFITLLARLLRTTRAVMFVELSRRYTFDSPKIIDPATVERYHQNIWEAKPLLTALRLRGVSDNLVRKYRLGERDGRVTIPITNEMGYFVNVRKYLPGAPGSEKMRNTRGHGKIRLFPYEQLRFDDIVLCGGEIKAIVAAEQLNPHNIGAITATAGEGNWDHSLTPKFEGKRVWVLLDTDDEGRIAAQSTCAHLHKHARWLGDVVLPLDRDRYPHGDVNDFIATEHGDLLPLLEATPEWLPTIPIDEAILAPLDVELGQAVQAEYVNRPVRFKAVVSALDNAPYVIPHNVEVKCDRSEKVCPICPVHLYNKNQFELHPENPAVLEMIGVDRDKQRGALMRAFKIPAMCRISELEATDYYNAEDSRVSPQLEITSKGGDRTLQPAVCIGVGLEANESYLMTGRMHPHPRSQLSTLLVSKYEPTQDALSTYKCADLEKLLVFRPDGWTVESLDARLNAVYADLEANATRIFQRRDLHLTIDLAYHSPLHFSFDGRTVKGWVEVLVLGDSSQGKSETAMRLKAHYGLGEKVECKNASVAGLLGGLQSSGNRWFVTWGVIPTHDRRLVIMEEVKGASPDVISKLTDMRSSGIAEIPKIEKRRTHARTRLVWLSNPRGDQPLSAHNFGVEAVRELVGGLEDVRRFDMCLLVSKNEIDAARLNMLQSQRPTVDHVYTGPLCRALVLWAWTRGEGEVIFEDAATEACLAAATYLSGEFTEDIPLIDRGSARHKVARLAAALAVRTFSASEDFRCVIVRKCHVDYITQLLLRIYSSPISGYADLTAAQRVGSTLLEPKIIESQINQVPFPSDFVKQVLRSALIDLTDIQDWCAWDRPQAAALLSFLVRKHALVRDGRAYRKTSPFIVLLKEMCVSDRPSFIQESGIGEEF